MVRPVSVSDSPLALLRTDATRTRFLARVSVTSCPKEFAPPLLNDRRVTHSLEPPQEKASVADACQDGLEQFGQERLAQRVSASNERCNEVPRFVRAQGVGCEITLEQRAVADRSPSQPSTVATQLIHATCAWGKRMAAGYWVHIQYTDRVDGCPLGCRLLVGADDGRRRYLTSRSTMRNKASGLRTQPSFPPSSTPHDVVGPLRTRRAILQRTTSAWNPGDTADMEGAPWCRGYSTRRHVTALCGERQVARMGKDRSVVSASVHRLSG